MIEIRHYENNTIYWNSWDEEINPLMILAVQKKATYAHSYNNDGLYLYAIHMKDGVKHYTDMGGFRKINKIIKEQNLDIEIISRSW
jgi:hypothetical protein